MAKPTGLEQEEPGSLWPRAFRGRDNRNAVPLNAPNFMTVAFKLTGKVERPPGRQTRKASNPLSDHSCNKTADSWGPLQVTTPVLCTGPGLNKHVEWTAPNALLQSYLTLTTAL